MKTSLPSADRAFEILDELEAAFGAITDDCRKLDDFNPIEVARTFVALRLVSDRLAQVTKPFEDTFKSIKDVKLPEIFDREKVPSVNLEEGYRITVSHNVRASIKPEFKTEAYEWLRDNGLGDLITPTVNASTLSAAIKAMAEENREPNSEYFSVYVMPTTSFNRTKK